MVVKSATKKKLMDVGVDEEYAHQLAWERKWQGVVVLSPRNILTNLFGASTWNEDPDFNSAKKPNLNRAYPLRLSQMERLSPRGAKHLEIVNDIYKKVHGIETVKQYREERSGVPFGIINHPRLFRYEVYEYIFRHRTKKDKTPRATREVIQQIYRQSRPTTTVLIMNPLCTVGILSFRETHD